MQVFERFHDNDTKAQRIHSSTAASLNHTQPLHPSLPSPSNFSDGLSAFPETFSELNFRFVRRRRRNNLFLAKNVSSVVCYERAAGKRQSKTHSPFMASSVTLETFDVLSSANLSLKGCVNPAPWITLAAGESFRHPLGEKYALQITCY